MPAKEPEQDPLEGHPVFEKLKFINSGSFGYVILARNKVSGEQVAIKFVEVKYVLENHPICLATHMWSRLSATRVSRIDTKSIHIIQF